MYFPTDYDVCVFSSNFDLQDNYWMVMIMWKGSSLLHHSSSGVPTRRAESVKDRDTGPPLWNVQPKLEVDSLGSCIEWFAQHGYEQ